MSTVWLIQTFILVMERDAHQRTFSAGHCIQPGPHFSVANEAFLKIR